MPLGGRELHTTAQTLAQNDVATSKWQHSHVGHFSLIAEQWKEAALSCPSLLVSVGVTHLWSSVLQTHIQTVTRGSVNTPHTAF